MVLENQQIDDTQDDDSFIIDLTQKETEESAEQYAQENLDTSFDQAVKMYTDRKFKHSVIRYNIEDWLKLLGRRDEIIQD